MKFRDYYEVLGVSREATEHEIRKAFRKLARKYHPDVAEDQSTAEDKFKELNEAYEVLGNAEKRAKYDALGENWRHMGDFDPSGAPGGGGAAGGGRHAGGDGQGQEYHFEGAGFSDFFENFFGGSARRPAGFDPFGAGAGPGASFGAERGAHAIPGREIEADIMVTLHEAVHGSERTLTMKMPSVPGEAPQSRKVRFRVPSGVTEGQRIRLAGYGGPGHHGGRDGDLFLDVRLERHPDFRVQGHDLYCDLLLAPWEAVLGALVPVRTLYGEVQLKITPGTGAGTQLRVRGKGLPTGEGDAKGDLYAVVEVVTPETVTEDEQKLWSELADRSSFDPRKP
jgi:curved DNA-binding protein